MNSATSLSLLQKLRNPDDLSEWPRFVRLYTPLLLFWARKAGLQDADAWDLTQDVLSSLLNKLREFEYDREKTFRGWLRRVTRNKWIDRQRLRNPTPTDKSDAYFQNLEVPVAADMFWEVDYRQQLKKRALEIMQSEFEPKTWKACWELAVEGRSGADVARELGLSEGAVYVAKSRVLKRLREELAGLLD